MWWIIGGIVYLAISLWFDTSGMAWYKRVVLHTLWLPLILLLIIGIILDRGKTNLF